MCSVEPGVGGRVSVGVLLLVAGLAGCASGSAESAGGGATGAFGGASNGSGGDLASGGSTTRQPCRVGPDCADGMQCAGGACVPAGSAGPGDGCLLDADCAAGLKCAFIGLSETCVTAGDTDAGGSCTSSSDCYEGLGCDSGSCGPAPPPVPVFQGVDCEAPSKDDVRAYFEVPGADGALAGDFFRLPFPNDVRRSSTGLDLSDFPTPGVGALGVDAVKLYRDALAANDQGWGASPTVTFRFSGPVDSTSIRDSSAVAWVDVTPDAPELGSSAGLFWYYSSGRNQYVCDNWLGVRRPHGAPLLPGHTYAVYLSTAIRTVGGGAVTPPPNLVSLLDANGPSDPALAAAYGAYAPFRAYLAAQNIDAASVLDASVFTVGGVRDAMASLAAAIAKLPAPKVLPGGWVTCSAEGAVSPCPEHDGARNCGAGTADYDEYQALVPLPIFQAGFADGKEPYLNAGDGGGIVVRSDPPLESVCLSITVPKGNAPAKGWPLVVFAHGTGGSFRDHVTDSVAGVLSRGSVKFAVLGIDQVEHGPRRGASTLDPDQLFFNFLNPDAARGNPLQGAADQLSLAEFAAHLGPEAEASFTIDPDELFFFGHSQGATEGSLMLPYADRYKAAVLSGNGASLLNALLTKTKPIDIASLLPIAISDLDATGDVAEFHPVLGLVQAWIDPADPLNFARYAAKEPLGGHAAKHLFQTYGLGDSYAPPVTLGIYAIAGGLTLVNPVLDDLGLTAADAPVSGNEAAGTITLGVRQYEPAANDDGHFVVFDNPDANADMVRFFEEAASGVPSIGAAAGSR